MRFVVRVPPPDLAPLVESIWLFEADAHDLAHRRERIVPFGIPQLLVNLHEDELRWYDGDRLERTHAIRGASIAGPHDAPFAIDTLEQRRIAGVAFRAGGLRAFLREPVAALAREHVELDRIWGREGAVVRERLLDAQSDGALLAELERVLRERMLRTRGLERGLDRALEALERGATVRATAAAIGATDKALVRAFESAIGLGPKRWARVRRFQRVLATVSAAGSELDGAWARVAAEHGYADHAHLVHEFRALAGITPTEYRARAPDARSHVPLDPNPPPPHRGHSPGS